MNDLRVSVGGSTSGYDAAMRKVRRQAQDFARSVSGTVTGGFGGMVTNLIGAAALGMLARRTMAYADEIEETSTRIGVGMTKLQEWGFAAAQSGASLEKMTRFIEQLTDAASDSKNADKFKRMGISPEGMTPEALFMAVNQFARKNSSTEVRSALDGLVQTRSLGPMINLLQSDLEALGDTARSAGAVMEEKLIHQAAALNDQFSILSKILFTQFAPALLIVAKVLLRTHGLIAGVASQFGAETAGLSIKEILLGPFLGKAEQQKIFDRVKNDPNQKIYNKTAANLFAEKITSIEDMIKLIENWKAPPLPTITQQDEKEKKLKMASFEADSLAKVGGFTASSVLFNPTLSVAKEQLNELRAIRRGVEHNGLGGLF